MAVFRDLGESCIVEKLPSSCISSVYYLIFVSRIVYIPAIVIVRTSLISVYWVCCIRI